MEAWLHEQMLRVAKQAGVIGHRRVVDSRGIWDRVLTQDTVSLVRSAVRRCLSRLGELDPARGGSPRRALAREEIMTRQESRRFAGLLGLGTGRPGEPPVRRCGKSGRGLQRK